MTFTLADMVHLLGESEYHETRTSSEHMVSEVATEVETMSAKQIKAMFPSVSFSDSEQVVYFPLKMCHSLPKVNARGRAFTPKVLFNSCASAVDSLINFEHHLRNNGIGKDDLIIGHIKAAVFDPETSAQDIADATTVPAQPIPMYALGSMWLRASAVPEMVQAHLTKKQKWATSMECGHKWHDAAFYYEKEFIPLKDADSAMLQCIGKTSVKSFKNKPLAVCLGGLEGKVDFWGLGMTTCPADVDADILALVAGSSMELATQKIFYMPLRCKNFSGKEKTAECASNHVDKVINELAAITVLGHTEPADDGHSHPVLSDMTVLPAPASDGSSHDHYGSSFHLTRGTNPRLTGRTGSQSTYRTDSAGNRQESVHMHLIDIPLKGKSKTISSEHGATDFDTDLSHLVSHLSGEDEMAFKDLLAKLEAAFNKAEVSTGKEGQSVLSSELASLRTELANLSKDELMKEVATKAIDDEIKAGRLVRKEVADEAQKVAVDAAVKTANDKAAADLEAEKKRAARLTEVTGLGIDLDLTFDDSMLDGSGKPLTIKSYIESIDFDAKGDNEYKRGMVMLKAVAEANKKSTETTAAASANALANKGKETANKPTRTLLHAVGSPSGLAPAENDGVNGNGSGNEQANQKKLGRHAVTVK